MGRVVGAARGEETKTAMPILRPPILSNPLVCVGGLEGGGTGRDGETGRRGDGDGGQ